jgi:hypothetical protein
MLISRPHIQATFPSATMLHYKRKIDSAVGVVLIYGVMPGLLLSVMAFHAAVLWKQPRFVTLIHSLSFFPRDRWAGWWRWLMKYERKRKAV